MYNFKFNFELFVSIETKTIPINILREDNDIYLLLSRVLLFAVIKKIKIQSNLCIIWLYFMKSMIQKYDSIYINIIKIVFFSKIIIFDKSKIAKSKK